MTEAPSELRLSVFFVHKHRRTAHSAGIMHGYARNDARHITGWAGYRESMGDTGKKTPRYLRGGERCKSVGLKHLTSAEPKG